MDPLNLCRHLRTKKLYTGATPEEAFGDRHSSEATPCHFWCNLTQASKGMDDRPAHKASCNSDRACFQR